LTGAVSSWLATNPNESRSRLPSHALDIAGRRAGGVQDIPALQPCNPAHQGEIEMNWTTDDQNHALAEGWGIFDNSDHGMRIERHDALQRFDCDAAAQAFVAVRAILGDKLAQLAWDELAWHHAVMDAAHPENDRQEASQ